MGETESRSSEALAWDIRLGANQPQRLLTVVFLALVAGVVGIALLGHWLFGVIGVLAVLLSASELFLPLHYSIDETGARQRIGVSVTEILWPNVKRVQLDQGGVKLSPFEGESRLEPFRGVYLRFSGNREEVLAKIRQFWRDDERLLAERTDG